MTASSTWEFMTTFPFLPEALRLCGDQHSCASRERPPDLGPGVAWADLQPRGLCVAAAFSSQSSFAFET